MGSPRLTLERQASIADLLRRDGRVLAGALAERFGVSEDTIRRDLREMAADGQCRRVYGGALPVAPDDGPILERTGQGRLRKAALAEAVACTIAPGSRLFLDAGSTNLAVAAALAADAGLTVVTNAPSIASVLADRGGFEIIVVGGRLDPASGACLGPQALRDLDRFRFSAIVLGACGVDALAGVTAHAFEEAELKAAAAERSAAIVIAATNEKVGTAAAFHVVPARRISRLVVEADCPASRLAAFPSSGVAVSRAARLVQAGSASLRRPRRAASSVRHEAAAPSLPGDEAHVSPSPAADAAPPSSSSRGALVPDRSQGASAPEETAS